MFSFQFFNQIRRDRTGQYAPAPPTILNSQRVEFRQQINSLSQSPTIVVTRVASVVCIGHKTQEFNRWDKRIIYVEL